MVPFSGEITKEVSREIQECEAMKETLVVSGIFGIRLPSFVGTMINLRIPISTTSFSRKVSGFFFVAYVGKIRLTSAALGSGNSLRA